jgi:hypothetical protein
MSGTIVVDRIESDASYASSINIASPLVVANTVSFSQPVTVSNTFVVPAGSASAPAITPTGDTNTGIYFPAADNIGFATNGVIRGRWTTDGLCFNADTAAANALDDYEEGTWTPFIFGGTTAGTYTYESDRTGGKYVKVGRTVWFYGGVRISTRPTPGSGSLNIGGLPFTSGGSFAPAGWTGNMTMCYAINTVSGVHLVGRIDDNSTNVTVFDIADLNYTTNTPQIGTYDGISFWLIFEGRYTTGL